MTDLPILSLTVSDFRRLQGTRILPFDAPIVLIHGPNGTGKTSVLSALELALTGEVRSMLRQDDRYIAHLPFLGQPYATVRADVADYLRSGSSGEVMTVGGSRIEGQPAFADAAAKFYSERCYLDQASLGRLLELYQAKVGKEESALAKFVNELLGLEKLDALRAGLSAANDLRLLKKLAVGLDEAASRAKTAESSAKEQSAVLEESRTELGDVRGALRDVLGSAIVAEPGVSNEDLLRLAQSTLDRSDAHLGADALVIAHQGLLALSGRIAAMSVRPSAQRLNEARTAAEAASVEQAAWQIGEGQLVADWEGEARLLGVALGREPSRAVELAVERTALELAEAADLATRIDSAVAELELHRRALGAADAQIAEANEHSSALVEGLTALRSATSLTTVCPVCDRDFSEISDHSLREHVDLKISELTTHGQRLIRLRTDREQVATKVAQSQILVGQLQSRALSADALQQIEARRGRLLDLASRAEDVDAARQRGAEIAERVLRLKNAVEDMEAAESEDVDVRKQIGVYAAQLGVDSASDTVDLNDQCQLLLEQVQSELAISQELERKRRVTQELASRLNVAMSRHDAALQAVANALSEMNEWNARHEEGRRRQSVAREVHDAATKARTAIVQRVFTESLNEVWRRVFTRLAPNESFVPRFGVPTATKAALEINLETTHRSGEPSGPPQMMLSAGNLNTAALSLFLALHLAVEPLVPCLVFDDPVQAMDEVHVAQFAALIRMLAKQNGRQVVIAVHERELFEYLALELSPAFEGDQLITIELGDRAADLDQGITRHVWRPDTALAG